MKVSQVTICSTCKVRPDSLLGNKGVTASHTYIKEEIICRQVTHSTPKAMNGNKNIVSAKQNQILIHALLMVLPSINENIFYKLEMSGVSEFFFSFLNDIVINFFLVCCISLHSFCSLTLSK